MWSESLLTLWTSWRAVLERKKEPKILIWGEFLLHIVNMFLNIINSSGTF